MLETLVLHILHTEASTALTADKQRSLFQGTQDSAGLRSQEPPTILLAFAVLVIGWPALVAVPRGTEPRRRRRRLGLGPTTVQ